MVGRGGGDASGSGDRGQRWRGEVGRREGGEGGFEDGRGERKGGAGGGRWWL